MKDATQTAEKFYNNGLRFECQGDGKCCLTRGEYGYVYLTFRDRKRIATHLGLSLAAFQQQYVVKEEGWYCLRYEGRDCRFLLQNKCSIYDVRPAQCRTWPFWNENMNSATWKQLAAYCPGIGKGRLYSSAEIDDIIMGKRSIIDKIP
jgi:uncharacterized protein